MRRNKGRPYQGWKSVYGAFMVRVQSVYILSMVVKTTESTHDLSLIPSWRGGRVTAPIDSRKSIRAVRP